MTLLERFRALSSARSEEKPINSTACHQFETDVIELMHSFFLHQYLSHEGL